MSKKMLIDATHSEETRVVVLENGRVEELDVDTSTKKQIKLCAESRLKRDVSL